MYRIRDPGLKSIDQELTRGENLLLTTRFCKTFISGPRGRLGKVGWS